MAKTGKAKGKKRERLSSSGTGRDLSYTRSVGDRLCMLLSEGKSLRKASREMGGKPTPETVRNWLRTLPEGHPFLAQYARAREDGTDALVEEIVDLADRVDFAAAKSRGEQPLGVDAARLMIDAREKYAKLAQPRKYGAKLDVTSGGEKVKTAGAVIVIPDNGRDPGQATES